MQVHQPIWKNKKTASEKLKHREDIVTTNSGKEGAVVIIDVKYYIKESERQLYDTKHYRHLKHDITTENNATFNIVITRFRNDKFNQ